MYFTHSYAAPVTAACVASRRHGAPFAAVVERDHVAGVQFHPEKSGDAGLRVLRNFLRHRQITKSPDHQILLMLSKRIIACLDVRDGRVVKGVNFNDLSTAGDPAALARRYNAEGIDELVILDVTATIEKRRALAETIRAVSARAVHSADRRRRHPVRGGRGCRNRGRRRQGQPEHRGARRTRADHASGRALRQSQAVVVAIDAKRDGDRFDVYARSGRDDAPRAMRSNGRARRPIAAPARSC